MSFLGGLAGGAIGGAVVNLYLDDKQFKAGLAGAEAQTKTATTTTSKFGAMPGPRRSPRPVWPRSSSLPTRCGVRRVPKVMAQTEATIKSTGGAAGFTVPTDRSHGGGAPGPDHVQRRAIQSAENLLLTFTKIGHEACRKPPRPSST